jgi:hypothetical protein
MGMGKACVYQSKKNDRLIKAIILTNGNPKKHI